MVGFGFENQFPRLVGDAMGEVQPDTFSGGGPDFDGQHVVVAGGCLVAQMAFEHGEDGVAFLPLKEGGAEVAEEFTARDFEQIQVTPVVNVVADGAIGVGDAVRVVEDGHAGSLGGRGDGSSVPIAGPAADRIKLKSDQRKLGRVNNRQNFFSLLPNSAFDLMWMRSYDTILVRQRNGDCANTVVAAIRERADKNSSTRARSRNELLNSSRPAWEVDTDVNLVFQSANDDLAVPCDDLLDLSIQVWGGSDASDPFIKVETHNASRRQFRLDYP